MKPKEPKTKLQATLRIAVNGRELVGEKRRGRWKFTTNFNWSPSKYNGSTETASCVAEFMSEILAGEVRVKLLQCEEKRR